MIVPQPGTDQIIFPQVVELLTLLESVSRVAFCRQCYLPGSACRCLESSSTASTASTTGPLWSDIADPTFGTNPAPAGRGAGSALPYGSSATTGGSIWDLSSTDFPGLPGAPLPFVNHAPCWEGFSFGKPAHGHLVWTDGTARSLRLPQPTWMPPTTQNRLRVQLPPPPPKMIQPQRLTRVSRQRPRIRSLRTRNPATRASQARGPYHGTASPLPRQPHTSQQASGRSGGTSRSDSGGLPTGTRWPSFRTTVAGVGKRLGLLHGSLF